METSGPPVPRKQAERVCSEPEFDLIKSSWEKGARAPNRHKRLEKVKRLRRLRDKYRDIAHRESRRLRRTGWSLGEIQPPQPRPKPPPLTRNQRLLQELRPTPLKPLEDLQVPRPQRKPVRVENDLAIERAAKKAQIFDEALRRLNA